MVERLRTLFRMPDPRQLRLMQFATIFIMVTLTATPLLVGRLIVPLLAQQDCGGSCAELGMLLEQVLLLSAASAVVIGTLHLLIVWANAPDPGRSRDSP